MVFVVWNRSFPAGKNKGKVPRRIHKAEREKLKREQLNELFLDLASALGKFLFPFLFSGNFFFFNFCIHEKLN
jgi:hypothetical protein